MNTDKNWFALEVTVDSQSSEAIEFALNELDALGTEINNLGKIQSKTLCVVGYFNEKLASENVQIQLNEALRIYGFSGDAIKRIEWRAVENTDWLAEWKKHWKPTETEKFIVAPSWEKIENTEKILVRIEPSMAFGTGTHETTRLCLRAIEKHFQSGMSFFDVGTGTGILAIAAAKIGFGAENSKFEMVNAATQTVFSACDTDEDSVKIASENAEINNVAEKINFYVGSISEATPEFDFVCANVTADIIVPLLPLLITKTRKMLVLSGILKEQEKSIVRELERFQISDLEIETAGEWISVTMENKN